jgi:hypothetical protein
MPNSTMDKEHLLYCLKLETMQQVLKNTIKLLECQSDGDVTSAPSAMGTTITM